MSPTPFDRGDTTVVSTLDGDIDIYAVLEAVDYALRGIDADGG